MSSAAAPVSAPKTEWITQSEQLIRLHTQIKEAVELASRVDKLAEVTIRSVLASYCTDWFRALDCIDYKDKIPALPNNIVKTLNSKCPIRGEERKPDGTFYAVSDTHVLYYVPPGTANDLETRIKAFGETALGQKRYSKESPPKLRYSSPDIRKQYGDVSFEGGWVLLSKDILEESRNKGYVLQEYKQQVEMVQRLSEKSSIKYEVPSLNAVVGVACLHKIATGESLYPAREEKGPRSAWTHVKETTGTRDLVAGGFSSEGLFIGNFFKEHGLSVSDFDHVGVAVERTL